MDYQKIYTLSKPPTPDYPFLDPVRHSSIIKHFIQSDNACHTLNSEGEVDFYLLLDFEDDIEELTNKVEEFGLDIRNKESISIELFYNEEKAGVFCFNFKDPMDLHSLKYLLVKKRMDIYYINLIDNEYICAGLKTIYLPRMLCYDMERHFEGKKPLLLPDFSEDIDSDKYFSQDVLVQNAWGYYLDFTALVKRVGTMEEAEEIITRHILHGLSCLQRSGRQNIKNDQLTLWISRKISTTESGEPIECYSIYISGQLLSGSKQKDPVAKIIENVLVELPEFEKFAWVSPLAEEGIPIAALTRKQLSRINLTERFFSDSAILFQENFLPFEGYSSYYQKVVISNNTNKVDSKVCDFLEKRRQKYYKSGHKLSAQEILNLIKRGNEKDLPWIFENLERVKAKDIDEILVSLCEKYKNKIEPYLIQLLTSDRRSLIAVAILGLGMIESVKAVPYLVNKVKNSKREASLAKYALALIGEPALPYLIPLLGDKKAKIRIRTIETLSLLGTEKAFAAIKGMKKDRSPKVERAKKHALLEKTCRQE